MESDNCHVDESGREKVWRTRGFGTKQLRSVAHIAFKFLLFIHQSLRPWIQDGILVVQLVVLRIRRFSSTSGFFLSQLCLQSTLLLRRCGVGSWNCGFLLFGFGVLPVALTYPK